MSDRPSLLAALGRLDDKQRAVLAIVVTEWADACERFAAMHSAHEGYAVILEELDELWSEIKNDNGQGVFPRLEAMTLESVQVAAMALRFVHDVGDADAFPPKILIA